MSPWSPHPKRVALSMAVPHASEEGDTVSSVLLLLDANAAQAAVQAGGRGCSKGGRDSGLPAQALAGDAGRSGAQQGRAACRGAWGTRACYIVLVEVS